MSNALPPPGQGPIDPRGAFGPPPQAPLPPQQSPPPPAGRGAPPGYGYGPMPMMPVYYPPPRRGGVGRIIVIIVLVLMLGGSMLLNLALIIGAAAGEGAGHVRQRVIADGDDTQRVAVVSVGGLLMDDAAEAFDRLIGHVQKDANVKALVVEVDTPGGSVSASDQIYHRLTSFKIARAGVPVVIAQGAMATSGGYYVSCAGDYIVAQPTTLTGNIGVVMPRYNLSKLADKWGIEDTSLHSTGSDFKTAGSMFKAETPEERRYIQGLIDAAFAEFKGVVLKARPKVDIAVAGSGKVFVAKEAARLGLIDQIGYREDAYAKAGQLVATPLTRPKIIRYEAPPSLMDILMSRSNLSPAKGTNATVQGVSVQLDARTLGEWITPRMLYLWMGQ